ncbi:hypothetical protein KA089_00995 [Candidatus Woesebacteria bacterium]|nr:hypothetical protein [Candidatus Woesebacteria bacterium]
MFKSKKLQQGSTIIELLISLMVVGLVVTAVAAASTYSIKNTGEARFRQVATTLGQEVIEKSRNEKSRLGFINFSNLVGDNAYCFDTVPADFQTSLPTAGLCGSTEVVSVAGSDFTREVTFTSTATEVVVEVDISWDDSGSPRTVQLVQTLANTQ